MQTSEDLPTVAAALYNETTSLYADAVQVGISVIGICDEGVDLATQWTVLPKEGAGRWKEDDYVVDDVHVQIERFTLSAMRQVDSHWNKAFRASGGESVFLGTAFALEDGIQSVQRMVELGQWSPEYGHEVAVHLGNVLKAAPAAEMGHVQFKHGYLWSVAEHPRSKSEIEELKRIGDVFAFAYDRFLDLQAKERRAHEAEVEAALERVRAQALSMQTSDDIPTVGAALFRELNRLKFPAWNSVIGIPDSERKLARHWVLLPDSIEAWRGQGHVVHESDVTIVLEEFDLAKLHSAHPAAEEAFHAASGSETTWMTRLFPEAEMIEVARKLVELDMYPEQYEAMARTWKGDAYFFVVHHRHGYVFFWLLEPPTETEIDEARRFAETFAFAYERFLELQGKERRAREAEVEAALERVRAEAAAMRSTDDITNLLTALDEGLEAAGVPVSNLVLNVTDWDADRLTVHIYTVEGVVPVKLPEDRIIWRNPDNGVMVARTEVKLSEYAVRGWDVGTSARIRNEPYTGQFLSDMARMWELEIPEGVLPEATALVPFAFGELSLQRMADEPRFTQHDLDTAVHFADAVSLGYARYLDFRALEEANEEIQEATRLKSQFLATMSHELRTPMNAIIGFTRLVMRRAENLTERQRRNLDNVSLSATYLLALINDILDLSKVEAGRVDLKPSTFELPPLLEQCCATVGPTLGKSSVELTCDIDTQVGEVFADEDRLRQIVINLLSNALKFTDRGGVTVTARTTPLVIGEAAEPGVEISVADTGVGIPADKLDTVFEEFRQVDGSSTRRHQGTGLGLAITRRLIELMGGTIGATSEIGAGSVFTVCLPVTGRAAPAEGEA